MKCKFTIIQLLAQKSPSFGKKSFSVALPALVDKFADIKVKGQSADTLLMIAEKMTLNYTSLQVMSLIAIGITLCQHFKINYFDFMTPLGQFIGI